MNALVRKFVAIAQACGYVASRDLDRSGQLDLALWPNSPLWFSARFLPETRASVRGVVRADGLSGDRTDIHDIFGTLWALVLHSTGKTNLFIEDLPHPAVPYEVYGRILHMAPLGMEDQLLADEPASLEWFETVLKTSKDAIPLLTASFDDPHPESWTDSHPSWVSAVCEITGDDVQSTETSISQRLQGAMWQHFRGFESGVSVYRLTPGIMEQFRDWMRQRHDARETVAIVMDHEIDAAGQRDAVDQCRDLALRIASAVDHSVGQPNSIQPILTVTRSHVIAVSETCIIEVCGGAVGKDDIDTSEDV